MSMPSRAARTLSLLLTAALASCAGKATQTPTANLFPQGWPYSATAAPVTASHGMVVSTDELASQVGVDILKAGGNAVDAAVAVQFALAVVDPEAGNIGGGGFMVVRLANGTEAALDYREKAPLAATADMYLDANGNVTDKSLVGDLAAGVPGSVMGMWEAHKRFGSLPWARLLQPAIDLAANGFPVRARFLESMDPSMVRKLSAVPASAAQFLPRNGQPPQLGDTLRQPDLAATLRLIQKDGPDGFYKGRTADLIVAEMKRGGGIITHRDLEQYQALWRDPIRFTYRGDTIISMPPSSSGGVTMAEIANILSRYQLDSLPWHGPEMIHLYAEAFKRAYADRNYYLADPAFVKMPIEKLSSMAYADQRAADIQLDKATPASDIGPGAGPLPEGTNTTHYSIVDSAGDAVAVTTTLNSLYGCGVTVAGAGFMLNNEMDDFTSKPGTPNQYGLVQGRANAIAPGKRMLSAMTPTVVVGPSGKLQMVTGTPGGSTIITTVFQTISNVLDYHMNVVQAVDAPRVHDQHLPDQIFYERQGLDSATVAKLQQMGHKMVERRGMSGDVQMIVVLPDGTLTGWSDPRRGGQAIGY
jgi:gamma-glutamyltranspeptidase/glutathione hydrolase